MSRTLVVAVSVSRDRPRAERGAAPSVHQRERRALSDEERIALSLSPLLSLLVSVKVFQSPTAARARVLSLRPRKGTGEQQRRQKQDLQER